MFTRRSPIRTWSTLITIALLLFGASGVSEAETSGDVAVVELYVDRASPLECKVQEQWVTQPRPALRASWFAKGFDAARLMVLVSVADGETIHHTGVVFFDEDFGIVDVVDPCNETVLARVSIHHLFPDSVRLSTAGNEDSARWIRANDELRTAEGYTVVFRGVFGKREILAFEVIE
ncbi:MAG: hypothetical protein BAA04_12805 [Firmicutes bacterium ZCTH02-B6]|nr:MAG: hypothetical protein BAA04_12805 [Firmicutes bacterium ZCTH02-B6]